MPTGGEVRKLNVAEGVSTTPATDLTLAVHIGGVNGIDWHSPAGTGAPETEEFTEKVYLFPDGGNQILVAFIKVPQDYIAGTQVTLKIGIYSPSSSNTIKLASIAYLIRKNQDPVDDTTNFFDSTNAVLTNTVANMLRETSLDLTDSIGEVNSVAVAAGDALRVELYRDYGADTDTADIRFIPNLSEIDF